MVDHFGRLPFASYSCRGAEPAGGRRALRWADRSIPSAQASHVVLAVGIFSLLLAGDIYYWRPSGTQTNRLRITHLNVGQGDAAVVELPGGKVLVIDAGGAAVGDFDTGESIVAPYLRSRKILKIDYLLVSHARIDHYGGMRALVQEFSPERVLVWRRQGQNPALRGSRRGAWIELKIVAPGIDRVNAMPRFRASASLCALFGVDGSVGGVLWSCAWIMARRRFCSPAISISVKSTAGAASERTDQHGGENSTPWQRDGEFAGIYRGR